MNHYDDTWGGKNYNKILTKEYPSEDLQSTASTQNSSATFYYPKLVGNPAYMDGVTEGHFTLYNSSSVASCTVTEYTVTIKKTDDVAANETTLGSKTVSLSIDNILLKAGTYTDWADSGSAGGPLLILPIYIDIDKQKIAVNEKLLFSIVFTYTGGTPWIGHYNGSDPDDIKLKIPYATG